MGVKYLLLRILEFKSLCFYSEQFLNTFFKQGERRRFCQSRIKAKEVRRQQDLWSCIPLSVLILARHPTNE